MSETKQKEKIKRFLNEWDPEKIRNYLHQAAPYYGPYAEEYLSLAFFEQMRLLGKAELISEDEKLILVVPEGYGSTASYYDALNKISPVPVEFVTPFEAKIDYFTYDTTKQEDNSFVEKNVVCKIRELCTRYSVEMLQEAIKQYDSEEFKLIRDERTFYTEEDYNVSVLKEFYSIEQLQRHLRKYRNGLYLHDTLTYATQNEVLRAIKEYNQRDCD